MPNWVETIETNMESCPSAEEIQREVEVTGGRLSPAELWLKKRDEELKNELGSEIHQCHSDA